MSDPFRKEYRKLTGVEEAQLAAVKDQASTFYDLLEQLPASRERSLAMTKLEEAVMWAVKGITG